MIVLASHIKGIRPEKLTKLEGERGPFYVALGNLPREADICHFYADDAYQFFVVANWVKLADGQHDVDVRGLLYSLERGGIQKLGSGDAEYIKSNLRKLFSERDFSDPKYALTAERKPRTIRFSWEASLGALRAGGFLDQSNRGYGR